MPSSIMLARTAVVALALVSCFATSHALTAAQIVDSIRTLTTKSQALQGPASSITILNGPLIIVGQGPYPVIIAGFSDIVTTATSFMAAFSGTTPIDNRNDAAAVAGAFKEFVRVHQSLLNILINKADLFATSVPSSIIGDPVVAALRQVEDVVDDIGFALVDTLQPVPDSASSVKDSLQTVDSSLATAIKAYQGTSVDTSRKLLREPAIVAAA